MKLLRSVVIMMTAASTASLSSVTTTTAVATSADDATPAADPVAVVIIPVAVDCHHSRRYRRHPSQAAFINRFFPTVTADFIGIPNKCPRYRRESRLVGSERSLALLHWWVVA